MCVFLISPVPIAEPLTSELIDTPVFYNLAPRPIKYRVSVPIPISYTMAAQLHLQALYVQDWALIEFNIIWVNHSPNCKYYIAPYYALSW